MWPEKGSPSHMNSNAALSFSGEDAGDESRPGARLMDMELCWRMVPARSMAAMRSMTTAPSEAREVSDLLRGSGRNPWILSGDGEELGVGGVGGFDGRAGMRILVRTNGQ